MLQSAVQDSIGIVKKYVNVMYNLYISMVKRMRYGYNYVPMLKAPNFTNNFEITRKIFKQETHGSF